MPTSTTTPSKAKTTRRKPARKPAARKTARAKAARTRASHQTGAAIRQSQTATRETTDAFGDYAERAVLIPVGAALVARDRVVSTVSGAFSTYSSSSKTQAQLRRFERRGATARNRLERDVRKARVRVERELRQRRRELERSVRQRRRGLERSVNDLDSRREAVAKNGSDLANRVQERVLSLV